MKTPGVAPDIHTLTASLVGTWRTQETYEPVAPTPKGGAGVGEVVWRSGPGGFTLLEDYHSRTPVGELFGFGVIWWDQAIGLQHLWCININPGGCEMFPAPPKPGPRWDGKALVIDTEVTIGGTAFAWHEVIDEVRPTSFVQSVDIGESKRPLRRWLTSRATKVRRDALRSPEHHDDDMMRLWQGRH